MHGDKTIMVDEKSSAHEYKLKVSIVESGVIDGNTTVTMLCRGVDVAVGSAAPSRLEWAVEETPQFPVHGGSRMDGFKIALQICQSG